MSYVPCYALPPSRSAPHPPFLQIFTDATEFFSRKTPTLSTVIPAMDHIDTVLINAPLDPKLDSAIQTSIGIAKKTLNRYYALSDMSATYRITHSMSLDMPQCQRLD